MSSAIVIIGASLAGATAAITLREAGFVGKITLIGAEPHPPYERPPLSKKYLQGEKLLDEITVRPTAFYTERNIETRFGVWARHVDPRKKVVELENGGSIPYDKVLIATGVRNRKLSVPGVDLPGVYDLRAVTDADVIRKESIAGRKAILVGMGFIGSEVAATLRQLDVEVAVVEPLKMPLAHILGEQVGRVIESFHREHGVQMHFEESATRFEGDGRVEHIITNHGRKLECDFAVVGVGVEPVTEVVVGTGVKLDNGIVVDEYCQSNIEGIYAAGDVANHYHALIGRHIRVEHYQNAISQGQAAARNMLGEHQPYAEVHWFWSDQYDFNIQYAGFYGESDEFVVRGSLEERNFIGFYLRDRLIRAAVAINRGKDLRLSMPLIQARIRVDAEDLEDESVKLRTLIPRGS